MSKDISNYREVTHSLAQAIKQQQQVAKIYIETALWNVVVNNGTDQVESSILWILYLLESFSLANDYLQGKTFPIAIPSLQPCDQHNSLDVAFAIDDTPEGSILYLNLCEVTDTHADDFQKRFTIKDVLLVDDNYTESDAIKIIQAYRRQSEFYVKRLFKLIQHDLELIR